MASLWQLASFLPIAMSLLLLPATLLAHDQLNVIDKCWRGDPLWRANRQRLAKCSVGFAGKMTNNIGKSLVMYKVTDPSDNPRSPRKGTLRYGATMVEGKVWITFRKSMTIDLKKPLFVSSFTAIDGRGADVHIAGNGCLILNGVTDVIIHGLKIHGCKSQAPDIVIRPGGKARKMGSKMDGDAIRIMNSSKVWIDHNCLYNCEDGLLDVSRGSTEITISNNLFHDQDKVMLLGHDDDHTADKDMRVTVLLNHFGPNCNQRMPRTRHGYVHVANNYYEGWIQYAIGGSMNPTIISEGNCFVAPYKTDVKEVTWHQNDDNPGNFKSKSDLMINGAVFTPSGEINVDRVNYKDGQSFRVANPRLVEELTTSAGPLNCKSTSCRSSRKNRGKRNDIKSTLLNLDIKL